MKTKEESPSVWLNKLMSFVRLKYLMATLWTLISASCFVGFSWYLAIFADLWLTQSKVELHNLIYSVIFIALRYVFAHIASLVNYSAGELVVAHLKSQLYPHLLRNNQHDSVSATYLMTRALDDIKPYFSFFMPYSLASFTVGALLLVAVFWSEPVVGYILLVSFLVIPLQMIVIGVGAEALHKKHIDLFMRYSAVFYNRLQTVAEIVNLDNFKAQFSFLSKKSTDLNKATIQVMGVAILSSAVLELFVTIAIAAVAIYLGMSLLGMMPGKNYGQGYDFKIALFLLMLTPYFFFYLRKFVSAYHDRNRAIAAAKLLMPILKIEKNNMEVDVDEAIQSFEINALHFSYPDSPVKVLHNIHLSLPTRGLVLIKGISGSGKSTLLKICSGNLQVSEGNISINQHDNYWSQTWLDKNTSYMNQYPFVFDGTLGYNVFLEEKKYQHKNYPAFLEKILEKKEQGWDTALTHNGKQLSGGEKQLLTLARMQMNARKIAILDEPTANLDAETVGLILQEIAKMAEERLVIVASHENRFDAIASLVLNLNWGEQLPV